MNKFTINDIRRWNPCYDPSKYLQEEWTGTALDILNISACPAEDRLWVVLREDCIDESTLRLFAVQCTRQALALIDNPDQRSINACDVAERYANGNATDEELAAANDVAWDAVRNDGSFAAFAAWATASYAASYAAINAAGNAAYNEWSKVNTAEKDTAWDAANSKQIEQLKSMLVQKEEAR